MNDWVADWDDVLRRAGRSRYRSRRTAAIAVVVAAAAVVLLLPGIGIGGGLNALITGSTRPGLQFAAKLTQGNRLIGTVRVQTSRLFVAVDPKTGKIKAFKVVDRSKAARAQFRWNVQLAGTARVTSLRLVYPKTGRVVAQLCAPCANGAHGAFRRSPPAFGVVFGRGTVVAETASGETTGTFRLVRP